MFYRRYIYNIHQSTVLHHWISGGRTSCNDPMTHYLYNGDG
jgi:hypothetical protein